MARANIYKRFEVFQRRVLLFILPLSTIFVWWAYLSRPVFKGQITHYVVLLFASFPFLTSIILLFRPKSNKVISSGFTLLVTTYLVFRNYMSFELIANDGNVEMHTTTIAVWVPTVSAMIFIMLPLNRAAILAVLYYVGLAAPVAMYYLAGPGNYKDSALETHLFFYYLFSNGLLIGLMFVFSKAKDIVNDAKAEADELHYMALTDSLTSLPNRRSLEEQLQVLLSSSNTSDTTFSVGLLDIDHFKEINDTFGHEMGDTVLQNLATMARTHLRPSDAFGRWGGEEFLVILPSCGLEGALDTAERLRLAISEASTLGPRPVTVSIGVAQFREGEKLSTLLARADAALYLAKSSGRNRIRPQMPQCADPTTLLQ